MISNVVKADLEYAAAMWLLIVPIVWMRCLLLRAVLRIWKLAKVIITNGKKMPKKNNNPRKTSASVHFLKSSFARNDASQFTSNHATYCQRSLPLNIKSQGIPYATDRVQSPQRERSGPGCESFCGELSSRQQGIDR